MDDFGKTIGHDEWDCSVNQLITNHGVCEASTEHSRLGLHGNLGATCCDYGDQLAKRASPASEPLKQHFHSRDFLLLRGHNLAAQFDDLRIGQAGLLAHEYRAGVMGDHCPKEFPIVDRGLSAHSIEAGREGHHRDRGDRPVDATGRKHGSH